jgi:UDP-N-acetylmuramoyl-L-alanyl-D-glutamate--2,6-diaminopimelate ligase
MQKITKGNINAYVDFAHTPDALEKTLSYLSNIKGEGKLIVTFGAPGLRDTEKRPLMGNIVAQYADIMIVTDDDPDTEDRRSIIQEITK